MSRTRLIGQRGEDLAAAWLIARGRQVVDRNWRCAAGELDLITLDGDQLAVVEVKTRTGVGFGHPAEAVTAQKLHRLRRLTGLWLAAHHCRPAGIRVEVLAVLLPSHGPVRYELLAGER
ncbi:YraN family protein [Cellulomonas sp. NPDC089187]|uniref:YraN family protein n=1 Tax=Cellulomonas sp. NPDC089187 TaxID=3154970 RepID=UPI00341BE6A8